MRGEEEEEEEANEEEAQESEAFRYRLVYGPLSKTLRQEERYS
jgi:hypothetical protein